MSPSFTTRELAAGIPTVVPDSAATFLKTSRGNPVELYQLDGGDDIHGFDLGKGS